MHKHSVKGMIITMIPVLITLIPISLILAGLTAYIVSKLTKRLKPHELILLGIEVTIIGSFLGISSNLNLRGFELIIVLSGLGISILGAIKKV